MARFGTNVGGTRRRMSHLPRDQRTPEPGRIVAVLGPTNTGKTHYAIERMLAHRNGMIGLPLRLLAREVYDKVVKAKGAGAVALITGEEKIAPDSARYFVCTVEAMPLDLKCEFLAVDEIQLARDPDRGHIFTDRLLRARGVFETLLLGSDTMRPMIRKLLPEAEIMRRERLSSLAYGGPKKLTKLPKRTAIVAFSAEEVYAIAELIRRQRGGAAVVMGALSPRTRNAQVGLYQSGEVDFLVATDAIGMGLNMDVDHVAFASRIKFDGRRARALRADEVAQIAGRAGRFRADGQFGETGQCPPIEQETVERVMAHEFEPVEAVEWRNHALDFSSVAALIASLEQPPATPGLIRSRGASDEEALKRCAEDAALMDRVARPAEVRRIWDVCLTPDFRRVTPEEHARLIGGMAKHLVGGRGRLPQDWIAREVKQLERTEGDIETLQKRLAHVRTWTYVANRPDWLDDCEHWRGRTREIEDKLSDALHDQLTLRFIDRRTSALIRGLKREEVMVATVGEDGSVDVEGHYVGRLEGLEFRPDPRAGAGREGRAVRAAALKALAPEVERRLKALAHAEDGALRLDAGGRIVWQGAAVARVAPGSPLLNPGVLLLGGDAGGDLSQRRAQERLSAWLAAEIGRELAPLAALEAALRGCAVVGAARGLAYRLAENLGAIDRREADALADGLDGAQREALARLGVRFGRHTVFVRGLDRPKARRLLAGLRCWTSRQPGRPLFAPRKAASMPADQTRAWADYAAIGFRPIGPLAVRIDRLERFAAAARAARGPTGGEFPLDARLAGLLGGSPQDVGPALEALGYRRVTRAEGDAPARWRLPRPGGPGKRAKDAPVAADGPFAALAGLALKRGEA